MCDQRVRGIHEYRKPFPRRHEYRRDRKQHHRIRSGAASGVAGPAELFGPETGDDIDKFSRCSWHEGPAETRILDECTRWLAGPVVGTVDGGDHVGFLVEPTHGMAGPWTGPLAFGMVQDLTPGHPAS